MDNDELAQAMIDQWHMSCAFSQTFAMNQEPSRARHLRLKALMNYFALEEDEKTIITEFGSNGK